MLSRAEGLRHVCRLRVQVTGSGSRDYHEGAGELEKERTQGSAKHQPDGDRIP